MNKILLASFAVALYFGVGQTLQCYECKIGFWNLCYTTQKTCDANQQCFSGLGTAAGLVDVKMKGCLDVAKCNKTESTNFPSNSSTTTMYQMNKTCCATDLCNSALPHLQVSAVSMVLSTITALTMVKLLA